MSITQKENKMQLIVDSKEIETIKAIQQEILQQLVSTRIEDRMVSLVEAEALTGMNKQTLRSMFLVGELKGRRFGKSIRILKSSLFEDVNNGK